MINMTINAVDIALQILISFHQKSANIPSHHITVALKTELSSQQIMEYKIIVSKITAFLT
jgi:hypothetical protein